MENYKEKCEQYLERAKKEIKECGDNQGRINMIKRIFPELCESEDERIRKEILEYFQQFENEELHGVNISDWIDWLEKQGEKTIPKNIDDAALQYVDTCAIDGEVTHDNITEPYWNNHSMMNAYKAGWLEKQGEKTNPYSGISFEYNGHIWGMCAREGGVDILCDSQLIKHLEKKDEKPAEWSEEDEKMKSLIISTLTSMGTLNLERYHHMNLDEVKNWLKSIKPNHWKPSEQNIKDLEWCADLVKDKMGVGFHRLQVFIDEIKKL